MIRVWACAIPSKVSCPPSSYRSYSKSIPTNVASPFPHNLLLCARLGKKFKTSRTNFFLTAQYVEPHQTDATQLLSPNQGLVFPVGHPGSWDSGGIGSAVVRRYSSDNEERWYMWYQGWKSLPGSSSQMNYQGWENYSESSPDSKYHGWEVGEALDSGSVQMGNTDAPEDEIYPWERGSVGLALSSNGVHWSRGVSTVETDEVGNGGPGVVLEPNGDWWTFDTRHVGVSDVIIMSSQRVRAQGGVYWMFYSGGDAEELNLPAQMAKLRLGFGPEEGKLVEGVRLRPGLAMSNDGRNWARIEGSHHSGALFDVGGEGEWDSLFIGSPQVVFHEPEDLRMYYHSLDVETGKFAIGFARSRDGIQWSKMGKVLQHGPPGSFDELGVCARHVVYDEDEKEYKMIYEGVAGDGSKSFGMAKSKEGLWNWVRCSENPFFSRSSVENAWDCLSVESPCLVDMGDSSWRLYYIGVGSNGRKGVGMAESKQGLKDFKRCTVAPML